jgi:hypothetical protein
MVVAWPASGAVITLGEAVRIVLAVGPVAIALRPERVSSWDHRKLTGRC